MLSRRAWLYPVLVVGFVVAIAAILQYGHRRFQPRLTQAAPPKAFAEGVAAPDSPWHMWRMHATQPLARLLLQLIVIVAAARVFGAVARAFKQPQVIGEIAA